MNVWWLTNVLPLLLVEDEEMLKGALKFQGTFVGFTSFECLFLKLKPFFQTQGVSAHASCSEVPEIPTELNMNLSETQLVV